MPPANAHTQVHTYPYKRAYLHLRILHSHTHMHARAHTVLRYPAQKPGRVSRSWPILIRPADLRGLLVHTRAYTCCSCECRL
ncbi:hypothetical protein PUN28_007373 [Cardiocondyla obscurior]|uniref:Uncharacterized protein n=1 Tax=Cardiocondyla obscurior TaxID=286306 RepID=A0AAW2G2X5_9HYME